MPRQSAGRWQGWCSALLPSLVLASFLSVPRSAVGDREQGLLKCLLVSWNMPPAQPIGSLADEIHYFVPVESEEVFDSHG